jgi:hypothetical protein
LLFCGKGNDFSFAIEAGIPEHMAVALNGTKPVGSADTIRYELRLEVFNERQIQVKNEYLYMYSSKGAAPRNGSGIYGEIPHREWRFALAREYGGGVRLRAETSKGARSHKIKIDASMLALPRVIFESREEYPVAVWFHDLIVQNYLFYQPDLSALQTASPPGTGTALLPNAMNLPQLALKLQADRKRFLLWQEHVKTALSNIDAIEVIEREEDLHCYFRIRYRGGYVVTTSGLSEGTLRVLSLTILPYLVDLPAIVFLEEPETGIHPQAIEAILQSLSSAYESQMLISSHSPIVLANASLSQVICARLDPGGAASMISGREHPQLKEWKGRIDLGALLATGVLG